MFGEWLKSLGTAPSVEGADEILAAVRAHLPPTDEDTVRVVTCIAGLLGTIAYADRDYSAVEEERVRAELGRIQGMPEAGIDAIADALRRNIVEVSTVQAQRYCRALRELADRELRFELLQVLVDVAAADGVISHDEVTVLRQTTTALGLDQADYNAAQERHRDKLGVLKK